MVDDDERISRVIAEDFAEQAANERGTEPTVYTCPDCGGVLWQIGTSTGIGFRCHVGHTFAPEVLLGQKSEELEAALWACVRLLREKATLTRQTASRTSLTGNSELAARIEEQARLDEHHADVIRQLLEAIPGPSDQTMTVLTVLDEAAGGPGPQAE